MSKVLALNEINHCFTIGGNNFAVLKGVTLELEAGEIVGLIGQSGAGKSTLLQIAGLLEYPTSGEVFINGQPTSRLSEYQRTLLRREAIGFVYQNHRLLPDFTALENVMMPQVIAQKDYSQAKKDAQKLLNQVNLGHRLDHPPAKLSGGEQQRVAIIRALANHPKILLADEPTGNLDSVTAEHVFTLLLGVVREKGVSALIATHNPEMARRMDRIVCLKDGVLISP